MYNLSIYHIINILIDKSLFQCDQLCENIYLLIPWQNLPQKHCRLLLNPLIRSQRVLVLTGYFFTANRSLLVWVILYIYICTELFGIFSYTFAKFLLALDLQNSWIIYGHVICFERKGRINYC